MIQLDCIQLKKIQDILEKLSLSKEQTEQVLTYLTREKEEENSRILGKLPQKDLSKIPIYPIDVVFSKIPAETAGKLFQVLYVIGGSRCSELFSFGGLECFWKRSGKWTKAAQFAAVAADFITRNINDSKEILYWKEIVMQGKRWIEIFVQEIQKNSDSILKVIEEYQGIPSGKVFLWTIYFLIRYSDAKLGEEVKVLEADQIRLGQYEESLLDCLDQMFRGKVAKERRKEIRRRLKRSDFLKEFFDSKEIRKLPVSSLKIYSIFKWNSMLVFANCALSDCLRNVVAFWIAKEGVYAETAYTVWSLLEKMDFHRDLKLRGGNFYKWFGIIPKQYIDIAAIQVNMADSDWDIREGWKNTLRVLFWEYSELFAEICTGFFQKNYLEIYHIKEKAWKNVLVLEEVMKEENAGFFSNYLKEVQLMRKDSIIKWMQLGNSYIVELEGYLREIHSFETIFRVREELEFNGMAVFIIKNLLKEYNQTYGNTVFFRRCVVYAVLCQKYQEFYGLQEDFPKGVATIFAAVDAEGMDLAFQAELMLEWRSKYRKEWQKKLESAVKPVFLQYLKERKKETITAFMGTEIYGRYFLLLLLEEQAEENKTEILEFSKDAAALVRDKLVEILCRQTNWEEEVKKLLLSKRVTEREVAVRVLGNWNQEEDKEA